MQSSGLQAFVTVFPREEEMRVTVKSNRASKPAAVFPSFSTVFFLHALPQPSRSPLLPIMNEEAEGWEVA
jgi:hypothetical protein